MKSSKKIKVLTDGNLYCTAGFIHLSDFSIIKTKLCSISMVNSLISFSFFV